RVGEDAAPSAELLPLDLLGATAGTERTRGHPIGPTLAAPGADQAMLGGRLPEWLRPLVRLDGHELGGGGGDLHKASLRMVSRSPAVFPMAPVTTNGTSAGIVVEKPGLTTRRQSTPRWTTRCLVGGQGETYARPMVSPSPQPP